MEAQKLHIVARAYHNERVTKQQLRLDENHA